MWKGVAARLTTQPEEGMEVIATGRMTTFPGQSKYQLILEDIRPAGVGALMAMLEKRKAMFQAEGLFAVERKQRLPFLPEVIGVVTSPSGAVIRDILHRLRDRFPRKVLVWPVAVQGERCAAEVSRAIAGFNRINPGGVVPRPDLLIVARGGGSVEDLWGFNEEMVVRAAAASEIPLISAVGHETDTTLIDYVSDRRAPTPTAAAELAVPVRIELMAQTREFGHRMTRSMGLRIEHSGQRLRDLGRALPRPQSLVEASRQRVDVMGDRLPAALTRLVDWHRLRLSEQAGTLRPSVLRRALVVENDRLQSHAKRMDQALGRLVLARRGALEDRASRLSLRGITRELGAHQDRMKQLTKRLAEVQNKALTERRGQLAALARLNETLGYRATLKRGYAVVRGDGAVVTTIKAAAQAQMLEIEFADGSFAPDMPAQRRKSVKASDKKKQGHLNGSGQSILT